MKTHSLLLFIILACTLFPAVGAAQTFNNGQTGNVETTANTSGQGGFNKIKLETSNDDTVQIVKVERWDPWTDKWDDITSNCTLPAGSENDPVITLPEDAQNGDKFRVRLTASDGPDVGNTVKVTPSVTNM